MAEKVNYITLDMMNLPGDTGKLMVAKYMSKSVDIFRKYYPGNNYEYWRDRFDEKHLEELIRHWMFTNTFVFLAVASDPINIISDEKVVGIYVMQLHPSIMDRGLVAHEIHFMVDPNYGKYFIGPKLLRMGVEVAKKKKCLWVLNFNTHGYRQDKAHLLYRRVGGEKIGDIYRTIIKE